MALKRKNLRTKQENDNKRIFLKKQKLKHYLKRGLDLNEACLLADVNKTDLAFIRSDPNFEEFIKQCEAAFELSHLENISDVGKSGYWQASAWILERKFRDKYGKKDIIKHEYEIKILSFQKAVLEIINEVSPELKHRILMKLKNMNLDKVPDSVNTIEAEYVDTPVKLLQ